MPSWITTISKTKTIILHFCFCFVFFSGTAGDSLSRHRGLPFSTKDRDNDKWTGGETGNCALNTKGAWWYYGCHKSNLNGLYIPGRNSGQGMAWHSWKNSWIAVKRSEMRMRSLEIQDSSPDFSRLCLTREEVPMRFSFSNFSIRAKRPPNLLAFPKLCLEWFVVASPSPSNLTLAWQPHFDRQFSLRICNFPIGYEKLDFSLCIF